jgi:hypothetical protein
MSRNPYSGGGTSTSGDGRETFKEPIEFLGGLVTGFNCSLGWGGTTSQLTVDLVEEDDWQTPLVFPEMGTPHHFEAGDFSFNGLLRSVTRSESAGGGITYNLTLESPNLVLDGTQVILDKYSVDLGFRDFGVSNYDYRNFESYTGNAYKDTYINPGNPVLTEDRNIVNLVPNVFNIYKFYESPNRVVYNPDHPFGSYINTGFGSSQRNDMGMRWLDILWGLESMCGIQQREENTASLRSGESQWLAGGVSGSGGYGTAYWSRDTRDPLATYDDTRGHALGALQWYTTIGCGLHLGSHSYRVNFDELSRFSVGSGGIIPNEYRIGANVISIIGILQDLTETAQGDFFIELQDDLKTIKIRTILRNDQPVLGKVEQYVITQKSLGNTGSLSVGEAYADNVMGKVVIGDNQTRIFKTSTAVVPYGFYTPPGLSPEAARFPITSTGTAQYPVGNFKKFGIPVEVPNKTYPTPDGRLWYVTDELEIRFAAQGMESWRAFLAFFKASTLRGVGIKDVGEFNPYSTEAQKFNMNPAMIQGMKLDAAKQILANQAKASVLPEFKEAMAILDAIMNALGATYNEWGTKLLCPVPGFVSYYSNPATGGTGDIINEWDLQGQAYDFYPEIFAGNASTSIFNQPQDASFYDDSGLKLAHVVFPFNPALYNYSALPADSYATEGSSLYVKAQIDPKYIWHNGSPHALVTFPRVTYGPLGFFDNRNFQDVDVINACLAIANPAMYAKRELMTKGTGSADTRHATAPAIRMPSMAAIPQKSNRFVYGPWISVGGIGKANFEQDSSLKPESFGNYQNMNDFGRLMAFVGVSNMTTDEHGSVEIAGFPAIKLGDPLNGGPYLTDISTSIGVDKISTTYSFKTWKVDFGKIAKWQSDQFKRSVSISIKMAKDFRALLQAPKGLGQNVSAWDITKYQQKQDKRQKPKSPVWYISGTAGTETGYNNITVPVVAGLGSADSDIWIGDDNAWSKTALMSMDGLFRPFATKSGGVGQIPGFTAAPQLGGQQIIESPAGQNSSHINPLNVLGSTTNTNREHDIVGVSVGSSLPEHGVTHLRNKVNGVDNFTQDARGIGLRGPLVMIGWGFDFSGLPVPNKGNSGGEDLASRDEKWMDNHLTKMDKWKAGPVGDMVWDYKRGTWTPRPQLVVCTVESGASSSSCPSGAGTPKIIRLKRKDRPAGVGEYIDASASCEVKWQTGEEVFAYWWAYDQKWYVTGSSGGGVTQGSQVDVEVVCDVDCVAGQLVVKYKTIKALADGSCGSSSSTSSSSAGGNIVCSYGSGGYPGVCSRCWDTDTGIFTCSTYAACSGTQHYNQTGTRICQ